jgi:hypothetical protein
MTKSLALKGGGITRGEGGGGGGGGSLIFSIEAK